MVHTFKVGDAVKMVSVRPGWSAKVGDTGKIITLHHRCLDGEPAYVVELDKSLGIRVAYKERRLELLDDPLPPVPDSVMYFNSTTDAENRQHLLVQPHWELEEHLTVAVVKSGCKFDPFGYGDMLSINLDPDAALQLAHDIRRMAMEIKRKQKREDTI